MTAIGSVNRQMLRKNRIAQRSGLRADEFQGADAGALPVTTGQLAFERAHLAAKLEIRSPDLLPGLPDRLGPHPLFVEVEGPVESWERVR